MNTYESLSNRTSKRKRIYAHLDRINAVYEPDSVLSPITVEIWPTNRCNSKCHFCVYPKTDQDELRNDVFHDLVRSCIQIGVKAITFSGGGEPTMHKYLPNAIEILSNAGISVGLITNGVHFSKELIRVLNKCSWIRFSLLTSDPQEYYNYTGLSISIYENVLENIKQVTSNKGGTIIGSTLMLKPGKHDCSQILSYINLASDLGIDQIFFTEMVNSIGNFQMDKADIAQFANIIHEYAERKNVVTNIAKFLSSGNATTSRIRNDRCDLVERNLIDVIGANGNVYPCLGQFTINRSAPIGSLYECKLDELLKKKKIDSYIQQHVPKECRYCKNYTTREELQTYLATGRVDRVADPHAMFL